MTRDEIIKLARDAGIEFQQHRGITGAWNTSTCGSQAIAKMERFADLVAAVERIGCCAAIDEIDDGEAPEYRACQEAIRARGQS